MIWVKCIFGLLIVKAIACSPAISKRSLTGGVEEKDPNDPKYLDLAKAALKKYENEKLNEGHVVAEVTKATEQVVAGLLTQIEFNAVPVSCDNPFSCTLLSCHSSILEQAWLKNTELTVDCVTVP